MTPANPLPAGILLTVVADALFAGMDSFGKHLPTLLPVLQVIWGRRYPLQTAGAHS